MKEKESIWSRLGRFLKRTYRLVILNDETFGEKLSWRLSPLGLIIVFTAVTILMTTLVISLVAFTSLREYIPGYGTIYDRKEILKLRIKADSIEQSLEAKDDYLKNLMNVLNEKTDKIPGKPDKDTLKNYKSLNPKPSNADLQFRKEIEETQSGQVTSVYSSKFKALHELVFYSPVKGIVTTSYNIADGHFGVDVVTKTDETIKSPLDGTIIYTGFSVEDGHVIHIQHLNNLTSVFKHNSRLNKKTGDRVKAGEVVSIIGNTGTGSKGQHMHFELWFNGSPVNPEEFVSF